MKLINLFCTVFIALFVIGCTSETDKLAQTVKKWEGKKIIFPQKMIFSLFALDTLDYLIPENRYKIISYVDSGGCTECKLQLYKWRELAQEMSSIQEVVPILFFFHSNLISFNMISPSPQSFLGSNLPKFPLFCQEILPQHHSKQEFSISLVLIHGCHKCGFFRPR